MVEKKLINYLRMNKQHYQLLKELKFQQSENFIWSLLTLYVNFYKLYKLICLFLNQEKKNYHSAFEL